MQSLTKTKHSPSLVFILLLSSSVAVLVVNGAPPPPRIFGNKNALRMTLSPQLPTEMPEEELELESLKGHGKSNTLQQLSQDSSTVTTTLSPAAVKKPENEEKPALSDNANSLKFGHHNPGGIDETLFAKKSHVDGHKDPIGNNKPLLEHDQVNSGVWSELPMERDITAKTVGSNNIKYDRGDHLNFQLDYTPQDIAEYIFWTGDERGVAMAIGDFLQAGLVGREDAVRFLEDVKRELISIRSRYSASVAEGHQAYNIRNPLLNQMTGNNAPRLSDIRSTKRDSSPEMNTFPILPYPSADAGLNFAGPSSLSPNSLTGNNLLSVEELDYDEIAEKLRSLDAKMREYSLEEVIYQLAKDLFIESLKNSPGDSIQKFSAFIEAQAANGRIPKDLEKDVLEAMVGALVDAVDERGTHQNQLEQQQVPRTMPDGHVNNPPQQLIKSQPTVLHPGGLKKIGS